MVTFIHRLRTNWVGLIWIGIIGGTATFGFLYPWSHSVYMIYAPAARGWWTGDDIYAFPAPNIVGEPYRYSPLFAIFLSPLAFLPDSFGCALWRIANCAIYALGLREWCRQALPARWDQGRLKSIFLLVLPLSMHSMHNGQANLLM